VRADEHFVEEFGKWSAFDASDQHPFSQIIGSTLKSVYSLYIDEFECGVRTNFGSQAIDFVVCFDKDWVFIPPDDAELTRWRWLAASQRRSRRGGGVDDWCAAFVTQTGTFPDGFIWKRSPAS
jgi:hypothetical protein